MLLSPLFEQHFQVYNIFKIKLLLKYLTLDMFKVNAAKTNLWGNIIFDNVVKLNGLTTVPNDMLLNPLVLQHFPKIVLLRPMVVTTFSKRTSVVKSSDCWHFQIPCC